MRKKRSFMVIQLCVVIGCANLVVASQSFAGETKPGIPAPATVKPSGAGECVIQGIFKGSDVEIAMIGEKPHYINDLVCGGTIKMIDEDTVTMAYPDKEIQFRVGGYIFRSVAVAGAGIPEIRPESHVAQDQPTAGYLMTADAIAKDFLDKHEKNRALFLAAVRGNFFGFGDGKSRVLLLCAQMKRLVKEDLAALSGLSVPDGCQRHHDLIVAMCYVADSAWDAALNNRRQYEILFPRVSRIAQEIHRESRSINTGAR